MNDTWLSSNKANESRTIENKNENLSNIVSSVIHEYDIIDEPTVDADKTNKQGPEMLEKHTHKALATGSTVEQTVISYPKVNCKERIILCVDLSSEMDKVTFRSRAGDKWTPLKLVKRALGFFLYSKSRINKSHEYALVVLHNSASWVRDFTSNPKEILSFFDDQVLLETIACETFDASSLFDILQTRINLPVAADVSLTPPPYIVRVLMIYGRSYCPIEFNNKESFKQLDSSPYFFVDVMYVHEALSEENKCEMIFDKLCEFDEKGMSYVFEAARNPTRFYDQMSQLLAHPLQRPLQRDISYRLHNIADIVQTAQTS